MTFRDWAIRKMGGTPAPSRAQASDGGQVLPLDSPQLAEFLRSGGMSSSGIAITPEIALSVGSVWRSVTIICGQMSSKPFHIMEQRSKDSRVSDKATDYPLYSVLKHAPNLWQTPSEFKTMMQAHVLLRGNAYARIVRRAGSKDVLALIPLHPDRVEVLQRSDLSLVYTYARQDGGKVLFQQDDIFHLRDLTLNGVVGVSRMHLMRDAVGLAKQAESFGAKLFKDGVKPGLIVQHPGGVKTLSDEAYNRLKAEIEANHSGTENSQGVMLLEEGMTAESLGITNEDAQFLQTRQFQVSEIAMFFGVPAFLLGDSKTTTNFGTGIEQQKIGFEQFTMLTFVTSWEETIVRDLIPSTDRDRYYPKVNMNSSLRPATKDRYESYSRALGSGGSRAWMTINEIRELEDLPPLPGGDVLPEPVVGTQPKSNEPDGDDDVQSHQG